MIKQRFIVNADETIAPVNKIVELEPLADENGDPLNVAADVDYVEIRKECEADAADETDDTDEEKNKAISGSRTLCKVLCNNTQKYAVPRYLKRSQICCDHQVPY